MRAHNWSPRDIPFHVKAENDGFLQLSGNQGHDKKIEVLYSWLTFGHAVYLVYFVSRRFSINIRDV